MRKFMKYHGMNIDNANGLPTFIISPEAKMAAMPDGFWNSLVDPDEVVATEPSAALNRVTGVLMDNIHENPINLDTFPNGESALLPGSGFSLGFESDVDIRPDEWTVFTVIKSGGFSLVEDIVNNRSEDDTDPLVAMRISVTQSGNTIAVYSHGGRTSGAPQRLNYNGGFSERSDPALVMITFSKERGLAIWDNGEQVAHDPDDTQELETDFGAGEWRTFRSVRSRYGLTGQVNADLGLKRNEIYRKMIERHCRDKYGISGMPS